MEEQTAIQTNAPAQNTAPNVERTTFSKALQIVAFPVSAAVGYFFGHMKVRNDSYTNLRNKGLFEDLKLKRQGDIQRTIIPLKDEIDITKEMMRIDTLHAAELDKRLADKGYRSMMTRFKTALHPNQKIEAIMTGATAGGIVLGAFLAAIDHEHLFNRVKEHENQDGQSK